MAESAQTRRSAVGPGVVPGPGVPRLARCGPVVGREAIVLVDLEPAVLVVQVRTAGHGTPIAGRPGGAGGARRTVLLVGVAPPGAAQIGLAGDVAGYHARSGVVHIVAVGAAELRNGVDSGRRDAAIDRVSRADCTGLK